MNSKKIDKKLLSQIFVMSEEKRLPCFVFFKDLTSVRRLLEQKNIHIQNEYLFINALLCLAKQSDIFSLSDQDVVSAIYSLSSASTLMEISKKILFRQEFPFFGSGVGVAFIDTGLCCHCDFFIGEPRVEKFIDFLSGKKEMYDDNGHGTFVCGVCSGNGVLSKFKFAGIAPKSKIFVLKALNFSGEASANKILDAMEWIYDNHKKLGIDVVCMSFGSEPLGSNDPIMLGADSLFDDGVVVVAAAGNSGPEHQTIKSPGVSSKIITVGGIDDNRYNDHSFNREFFEVADFSSRGPAMRGVKPDVVAPSVDIISCGTKSNYTILSGTSVATPMIAGVACLILEKYPDFTPTDVKKMILQSCQPLGFEMNFEGFGLPNLSKI